MKKLLLSVFVLVTATLQVNAQNPTSLQEEFDSVATGTPCFVTWKPTGSFQGSAGHDFKTMTWNSTDEALEFKGTTHASLHGPLYYQLSSGDKVACNPGAGLVDISSTKVIKIKIKASTPFRMNIYVQEGNSPSWDYSKFSETFATVDLTTSYQEVLITLANNNNLPATGTIDLSQIGGLAFELGKTDGTNFDQISNATISIDYMRFGDIVTGTEEVKASSVSVYPNPASDVVNVAVASASTVELTDLTGKVVAAGSSNVASTVVLNTSSVPAGVYVVVVKSATGVATSKVVVQ